MMQMKGLCTNSSGMKLIDIGAENSFEEIKNLDLLNESMPPH